MSDHSEDNYLDRPIWGAAAIAREAGLGEGEDAERRGFYVLQRGYIRARKVGNQWVTTARAIRDAVTPEAGSSA